jgi:eukaryotic-like serine/threonine-protein kinase
MSNWKQVGDLFDQAMDVAPAQRRQFLQAAVSDPQILQEVERLIRLEEQAQGFLSSPVDLQTPLLPDAASQLTEGQVLANRYRIDCQIGSGGMCGGVYRALDLKNGNMVALKTLSAAREFQLARRVTHRNVCRVYDCDTGEEGIQFLTMELLRGQTLEQLLKADGCLSGAQLMDFTMQLMAGLQAAHEAGVLHRDLKPANIFLTEDGRVVIADFGLARPNHGTHSQQLIGTLAYMAPELLAGRPASIASDIYSLGVVLHEAATGKLPIDPAKLPAEVKRVIRCCLQMDPAMRPKSVDSLRKLLDSIENRVRGILQIWPKTKSPGCSMIARLGSPQLGRTSTPGFTTLSGLLS